MMTVSNALQGQAGQVRFNLPPLSQVEVDPANNVSRCTIYWENIQIFQPATAVKILINISGATGLCVDFQQTKNATDPAFRDFISEQSGNITILRTGSFSLSSSYAPLTVIYFRASPVEDGFLTPNQATISFSSESRVFVSGSGNFPISLSDPTVHTLPSGFDIGGQATKAPCDLLGANCSGATNNRITGVNFGLSLVGPSNCFPYYQQLPSSFLASQGLYIFEELPSHLSYQITPIKYSGCNCGLGSPINSLDINQARNYILGINLPNLQQAIASDFYGDGTINTWDLVGMQSCEQGTYIPDQSWLTWRFIDAAQFGCGGLVLPNLQVPLYESSVKTQSLTFDIVSASFIGVKLGDVNQDCSECGNNLTSGPEDRSEVSIRDIFCGDASLDMGQETLLPIRATATEGVSVFNLELMFDRSKLEVLGIQKGDLSDDYMQYVVDEEGDQSALRCSWFTMNPQGENLSAGGVLFYVRLRAKQSVTSVRSLVTQQVASHFNHLFYDNGATHERMGLHHSVFNDQIFSVKAINVVSTTSPMLEISSPANTTARLTVSDAHGRILQATRLDLPSGISTVTLSDFPISAAGVYFASVCTPHGQETVRILRY